MLVIDQKTQHLLARLRAYVEATLHAPIDIGAIVPGGMLPGYIIDRYTLVDAHLMGRRCLLMIPANGMDTPEAIDKHRSRLVAQFPDALTIIVMDVITSSNRHRLVQRHIPFIIPGNQLFIPQFAIDLREQYRSDDEGPRDKLTASAQLLIVASLNGFELDSETATSLRARFGYSAMTMGRAIDELEGHRLLDTHQAGKFRIITMRTDRRKLWKQVRKLLVSPVQRKRQVPDSGFIHDAPLGGESALARITDLSEPRRETRVLSAAEWRALAPYDDRAQPPYWDERPIDLQLWSYDPKAITRGDTVDPVSLWLSLPDLSDERYKMAKDQLLKQAGL